MTRSTSAIVWLLKPAALVALLPLAGCFTYNATTLESTSPGTQARIRLDDDGFGRVVNQAAMGGFPVESLDMNRKGIVGRIVDLRADSLSVEMRGIGSAIFTADIQNTAIQEVAVRSFSATRTLGAIAIGFALGATLTSGVIGGSTSVDRPPEPDLFVLPHVSIPLVWIPFP